jgi:hypothetical protein
MQQDLGGAAAEELEGMRLRSQSGANMRQGGSRTGHWGSGDVRGRSGAVAASRGQTYGGELREAATGWNQPEVFEHGGLQRRDSHG